MKTETNIYHDYTPVTILAVSDQKSSYLESYIKSDSKNGKEFNLTISCGDLSPRYLMSIADAVNQTVYYVEGNHNYVTTDIKKALKKEFLYIGSSIPGCRNLALNPVFFHDYIICGFEGSVKYNGDPLQFSEKVMFNKVLQTIRKIRLIRLKDKLLRKKPKKVIAVSHAPVKSLGDREDLPHNGFKAFRYFIEKIEPVIWLYGHIHKQNFHDDETYRYGATTLINVFEFKKICINQNGEVAIHHNLYENYKKRL